LKFLKARLNKDNPYGLTLTIGVVLVVNFLSGFISDLYQIFHESRLIASEPQIIALLQAFTPSALQDILFFITILANTKVVLAVIFLGAVFLLVNNKRRDLTYLLITAVSALIASPLLKFIVGRERPSFAHIIGLPSSPGFPSGHALFSLSIYGFLFYLLYKGTKHIVVKIVLLVVAALLFAGIGLSRVYLGVHFPTDVFAGWNLGMTILVTVITLYEIQRRRNRFVAAKPKAKQALGIRTVAVTLGILAVLLTISYEYNSALSYMKTPQSEQITIEQFISSEDLFSQDLYGQPMEPLSFLVIGDESQVTRIFETAGWERAQDPTVPNLVKLSTAIAKDTSYPNAPVTPAFYNGSVNALAFEKETDLMSARQRHHTRYWKTPFTVSDKPLWVATASFDVGVGPVSVAPLPIHKIDPAIDNEREFIISDMRNAGLVERSEKINLVGVISGKNAAGDSFYTDGDAYVVYPLTQ